MKQFKVKFRRSALDDVREAKAWYEGQLTGLGKKFGERLDAVVERLSHYPESGPVVDGLVRKTNLRRFPYTVFYVVEDDFIIVIGCRLQAQDSERWPTL